MTISPKGLRKITVACDRYFGKFADQLVVIKEANPVGRLTIDVGWHDVWLHVHEGNEAPPLPSPLHITPKLVREAIEQALTRGWEGQDMALVYRDGEWS